MYSTRNEGDLDCVKKVDSRSSKCYLNLVPLRQWGTG